MKRIAIKIFLALLAFIAILVINFLLFARWASVVSDGEQISRKGNGQSALLVVDIQEGTTGSVSIDKSYIDQADDFIRSVNLVTADATARGIPVIYIGSEVKNPLLNLLNSTLKTGSKGAEFDTRLRIRSEWSVMKHRNDAFHEEELNHLLDSLGVDEVILTGLDANECIVFTARGALNRGFEVSVIQEAVLARNDSLKLAAIEQYRLLGLNIR